MPARMRIRPSVVGSPGRNRKRSHAAAERCTKPRSEGVESSKWLMLLLQFMIAVGVNGHSIDQLKLLRMAARCVAGVHVGWFRGGQDRHDPIEHGVAKVNLAALGVELAKEKWQVGVQVIRSDLNTYLPFFFGEFDAEGRQINFGDPMLYWVVPILTAPKPPDVDACHTPRSHPQEFELIDGVAIHSHSDHELKE